MSTSIHQDQVNILLLQMKCQKYFTNTLKMQRLTNVDMQIGKCQCVLLGKKKKESREFFRIGCCELADVKSGGSDDSDGLPTVFFMLTLGKSRLLFTGITNAIILQLCSHLNKGKHKHRIILTNNFKSYVHRKYYQTGTLLH